MARAADSSHSSTTSTPLPLQSPPPQLPQSAPTFANAPPPSQIYFPHFEFPSAESSPPFPSTTIPLPPQIPSPPSPLSPPPHPPPPRDTAAGLHESASRHPPASQSHFANESPHARSPAHAATPRASKSGWPSPPAAPAA